MWEPYKKGYKAWLQLEKSLSDNSVEAYRRDLDKLTQFLEANHLHRAPADIEGKDLQQLPQIYGLIGPKTHLPGPHTLGHTFLLQILFHRTDRP